MAPTGTPVQYFPATIEGKTDDSEKDVTTNGNSGPIAAVISRDWGTGEVKNLTIFPDSGSTVFRGSVPHKSNRYQSTDGRNLGAYWDFIPKE